MLRSLVNYVITYPLHVSNMAHLVKKEEKKFLLFCMLRHFVNYAIKYPLHIPNMDHSAKKKRLRYFLNYVILYPLHVHPYILISKFSTEK